MRELTRPVAGQYPRPWMTALSEPTAATVFTVGMNQAKRFDTAQVGNHDRYMDSLFNRGPENCRALYDRLTGAPSPTRQNTDRLVARLAEQGVTSVLETNVVCYSTPMSAELKHAAHVEGVSVGQEIFSALLNLIRPRIVIAHGAGTATKLGNMLGVELPRPPAQLIEPQPVYTDGLAVFVIPSLAPPAYNKWVSWAPDCISNLARAVAAILR